MRNAIFASMILLAGCTIQTASTYPEQQYSPPTTQTYPGEPQGDTAYTIDPGPGVTVLPASYGISTSDGASWRLAWLSDSYPRSFKGTISCPANCQFGNGTLVNEQTGDTVTVSGDQLTFDWITDASTVQTLDFTVPVQPLTIDLYIDNAPALQGVLWTSGGVEVSNAVMPFQLYDAATAGLSVGGGKTQRAVAAAGKLASASPGSMATIAPPAKESVGVRIGAVTVGAPQPLQAAQTK